MSLPDGTFVESLEARLRKPQVIKVDGLERALQPSNDGGWQLVDLPYTVERPADTLTVGTLAAVLSYVQKHGVDLVHVVGYGQVNVLARHLGHNSLGRYQVRLSAKAEPAYGDGAWRPGTFYDLETTVIALQTRFASTYNRDLLLRLFNSIRDDDVRTHEDDGISQTVTARKGVALVQDVKVPSPLTLCPFRTFREFQQPESEFIIRMRSGHDGDGPVASLLESDGGFWKSEAIKRIVAYLTADPTPITVPVLG